MVFGGEPLEVNNSDKVWRMRHCDGICEMQVQFLSQEGSLEKKMVTHPSILAWKIPWTEEPGRL